MTLKRTKYIINSAVIALISLYSFAANAGVDGNPFEGMYVGFITTKSTFSSTAIYLDKSTLETPSNFNGITSAVSKDGYGAGIMGGYGLTYGMFYGSIEAAFVVDKGNTVYSDGTDTIKVSQSNTFDISFRPGITLSDKALVFGLLGYSGSNLKSDGINEGLASGNGLSYNKRLTSLRYGAGVEVEILENIAIRAEYTRSIINDALIVDGGDQFTISPKTSRIMLSFVLHMY
jgi:opacity protein-like surface antigen